MVGVLTVPFSGRDIRALDSEVPRTAEIHSVNAGSPDIYYNFMFDIHQSTLPGGVQPKSRMGA